MARCCNFRYAQIMIPIIFEDEDILVLDKPAGLVTTSSETQKEASLQNILASEYGIEIERSGIVHRLDKDTSGLLVAAKTPEALEALQAQFKNRRVKKEYLALVHGIIEKSGRVEAAIMRNPGNREKFVVASQATLGVARSAVTEYEPVQRLAFDDQRLVELFPDYSKIQLRKLQTMNYKLFTLLRCFPETGRTHQIRVHLKYLGFPIVGDDKYGGRKVVRLDRRWVPRQFLHACHLEFNHPKTGERMEFDSKLPADLERALGILEKT